MTIIFALLLEAFERNEDIGNEGLRDDLVAQLVEQYTFNVWALGSSPSGITKQKPPDSGGFFRYIHSQIYSSFILVA